MRIEAKTVYISIMETLRQWKQRIIMGATLVIGSLLLTASDTSSESQTWKERRMEMVTTQIESRGIKDHDVLEAMRNVKRHELVPESVQQWAYEDRPLPIGEQQTISQPYIVALMSELLQVEAGAKILEIGTGSGYQAAILAEMGLKVFTIEIVKSLGLRAQSDLARIGYPDVNIKIGDGYQGWPQEAPFDGIIITAAPPSLPEPLVAQLKVGGRMVVPVGVTQQDLNVYTKQSDGSIHKETIIPVRFVPMTGEAQLKR